MANAANLEVIVIDWLNSLALGYPASGDIPKDPPDKYITVDRTRGGRESMVLDRAEILIEVYNKDSRLEASNTALAIGDVLQQLVDQNENITRAVVNSTINLPDLVAQFQRYQVYCDIYHRR